MTAVDGTTITYDGAGNPLNYYNGVKTYSNLEWRDGRQLDSLTVSNIRVNYSYDADGIRTRKYTSLNTHEYLTQNGKVVRETIDDGTTTKVLDFIYDEAGRPFALRYSTNGGDSFTTYYYVLNFQGDVVKLVRIYAGTTIQEYEEVASYTYNAWGEILEASGTMAEINPLRYRGYYYDTETGFYYLQSRYYDPENCRFINADNLTSTGQGFLGYNMFAYCNNKPVIGSDPCGTCYHSSDMAINCNMCKDRPLEDWMFSPINGQSCCSYADVDYGWGTVGNNGCGVIALFNALGLYGKGQDITTIINNMGVSLHGRLLGTSPSSISKALNHFGVPYVKASSASELSTMLSNGGMAIVKKWNRMLQHYDSVVGKGAIPTYKTPDYLSGSHIVLITYNNGTYTVYNRYSNVAEIYTYNSFEDFIGSEGSYIAGFFIG